MKTIVYIVYHMQKKIDSIRVMMIVRAERQAEPIKFGYLA